MKRYAKAVPGKGIVASRILQSDNMYDKFRKGQAMLSDPDYKYLQAKLEDEVEAYLSDNDYDWSGEDGWKTYSNGYMKEGKYVGEGEQIVIETRRDYLSQEKGWEPYQ